MSYRMCLHHKSEGVWMGNNHNQPDLEVRVKKIIEVDGLKFKDLNNDVKLDPYEDWRLSPEENRHLRHYILRDNLSPAGMTEWINKMNEVAEGTRWGIPIIIASNSRHEVAENIYSRSGKVVMSVNVTLAASDQVIAVYQNGECVSRNDVPGYDKDKYMPEGLSYAYKDNDGNVYKLGHGLRY